MGEVDREALVHIYIAEKVHVNRVTNNNKGQMLALNTNATHNECDVAIRSWVTDLQSDKNKPQEYLDAVPSPLEPTEANAWKAGLPYCCNTRNDTSTT